jgi:V/A-type H+-transporting ATPase subunit I
MYGIVKAFVLQDPFVGTCYPYLLIVGGAMAILFAEPSRNVLKMFALGLANFPLSAISTFGDTASYLRLMAIGLAGSVLAVTFNTMTADLWWPARIPILMVAHALNVGLSIVALFAHGVRLNMLEFSSNLGMQWSGYAYEPFSNRRGQENQ